MTITFQETEPGIYYEYAVISGARRVGHVRKEDAREYPYAPTRKWLADNGMAYHGGFSTRRAAAAWLMTWIRD